MVLPTKDKKNHDLLQVVSHFIKISVRSSNDASS